MKKLRLRFAADSAGSTDEQTSERSSYASQLCVILTERCNIRCRHCINDCSPSRIDDLDMGVLKSFIQQAAELRFVSSIAFSGGEPFLDNTVLERAATLCRDYGLDFTVTTNGFWASSVPAARRTLETVAGLIQLGLSTDEFHQEFVPIERIANAITACHELGIRCAVVVTHLKDNLEGTERIKRQLKAVEGWYKIQQWPVMPSGRALTEIKKGDFFTYDVSNAICVSADTPTLNVSGELTACCGPTGHWPGAHRLSLNRFTRRSLKEILEDGDRDPIVQALRVWGPARLLDLAVSYAKSDGIFLKTVAAIDICTICEFLFTDRFRAQLVEQVLENKQIQRELAVARMAQLGEISMFLNLEHGRHGTA